MWYIPTHLGPLFERLGHDDPRQLSVLIHASVSETCNSSGWIFRRLGLKLLSSYIRFLTTIPLPWLQHAVDSYYWFVNDPSTSTHQSTLGKTLLQRDPLQIWTFHVCFKDAIAQHSFLMWLAHLEKLPTRARLARWVSISPNLVAFAINILRKEIICFFVVSGLGIYGTLACSEWPIVTSASILDNFLPMAVFSRQHFTDPSKELGVLSHCLLYLVWAQQATARQHLYASDHCFQPTGPFHQRCNSI